MFNTLFTQVPREAFPGTGIIFYCAQAKRLCLDGQAIAAGGQIRDGVVYTRILQLGVHCAGSRNGDYRPRQFEFFVSAWRELMERLLLTHCTQER